MGRKAVFSFFRCFCLFSRRDDVSRSVFSFFSPGTILRPVLSSLSLDHFHFDPAGQDLMLMLRGHSLHGLAKKLLGLSLSQRPDVISET